ncbi:MAG: hypothetical protein Q9218_004532 [Villophora microphyllina]
MPYYTVTYASPRPRGVRAQAAIQPIQSHPGTPITRERIVTLAGSCYGGPHCGHQVIFETAASQPGTQLYRICSDMRVDPGQLWHVMVTEVTRCQAQGLPSHWDRIYEQIVALNNGRPCGGVQQEINRRRAQACSPDMYPAQLRPNDRARIQQQPPRAMPDLGRTGGDPQHVGNLEGAPRYDDIEGWLDNVNNARNRSRHVHFADEVGSYWSGLASRDRRRMLGRPDYPYFH